MNIFSIVRLSVLCCVVFLGGYLACSPPDYKCTNDIKETKVNPNGAPCETICDCNNQGYEGVCNKPANVCISKARNSCENAGDVEPCTNRLNGETGQRICQDKGLSSLVFGDCKSKVTTEKIDEKVGEPSVEKAPEPSQEPSVEPAAEPNPEPRTEVSLEPSVEKRTEQAKEPIHEEPVRADAGEPMTEAIPEGCGVRVCYTASEETLKHGPCKKGVQYCVGGVWGACVGEITPTNELCGNKIDDDCDGTINEGCD